MPILALTKVGQQQQPGIQSSVNTPSRDPDASTGLPAMKSVPIHLCIFSVDVLMHVLIESQSNRLEK